MVDVEQFLKHMTDYDPVKAHEYYLQNRELKGRIAQQPVAVKGSTSTKTVAPAKGVANKKVVAVKKAPEETHKQALARVASLQAKLEQLRKALALLVKQAKARSGVETPDKKTTGSSSTTGTSKDSGPSKLTTAQKADKAKAAREAYEKVKKTDPKDQAAELEAKIAEVVEKIKALKAEIAAARSTSTSRSVGVRANSIK